MIKGIEPQAAREMLIRHASPVGTESVPLTGAAGRFCAADVLATIPSPPFDRSPYDGYAFRGEDTLLASQDQPVVLSVVETIAAGQLPTFSVETGTATRIMTGAPIPPGANATIKYESTRYTADEVSLAAPVLPGTDIVRAGEDLAAGSLVIAAGTRLTPPDIGLLASQGLSDVMVYRSPVVAVLSNGRELIEPGNPLPAGKIYNSSYPVISGYLREIGAAPLACGIVGDNPADLIDGIRSALEKSDLLITTGGASVGDHDFMITALQQIGAEILFWKVAMKPGGSLLAATLGGKLIIGLSGNPGAALLGLLYIAQPAIRKLCGRSDLYLPGIDVYMKHSLEKRSPRLRLLRGRLAVENGKAWFVENRGQGNGTLSSFSRCDLLAQIPAGSSPLSAGTLVRAWRLGM